MDGEPTEVGEEEDFLEDFSLEDQRYKIFLTGVFSRGY